jgi:hypothetical protein
MNSEPPSPSWQDWVHHLPEINVASKLMVVTRVSDFQQCLAVAASLCPDFKMHRVVLPKLKKGLFQVVYHPWLPMTANNICIASCHGGVYDGCDTCTTTEWTTQSDWWFKLASRYTNQLTHKVRTHTPNWMALLVKHNVKVLVTPFTMVNDTTKTERSWYHTVGQLRHAGNELLISLPSSTSLPCKDPTDRPASFVSRIDIALPPLTSCEESVVRHLLSEIRLYPALCATPPDCLYYYCQPPNFEQQDGCIYWVMGHQLWLKPLVSDIPTMPSLEPIHPTTWLAVDEIR